MGGQTELELSNPWIPYGMQSGTFWMATAQVVLFQGDETESMACGSTLFFLFWYSDRWFGQLAPVDSPFDSVKGRETLRFHSREKKSNQTGNGTESMKEIGKTLQRNHQLSGQSWTALCWCIDGAFTGTVRSEVSCSIGRTWPFRWFRSIPSFLFFVFNSFLSPSSLSALQRPWALPLGFIYLFFLQPRLLTIQPQTDDSNRFHQWWRRERTVPSVKNDNCLPDHGDPNSAN